MPVPDRAAKSAVPSDGRETVLLVDDESAVRSLAERILRRQGYQVFGAEDGAEALRIADALVGPIDILVTDLSMPGMTGAELARRLAEARPAVRVIVMSGYTEDALEDDAGASGWIFLEKPFSPDMLLARVREALGASAAAA